MPSVNADREVVSHVGWLACGWHDPDSETVPTPGGRNDSGRPTVIGANVFIYVIVRVIVTPEQFTSTIP